jgi:hypothetical protein
MSSILGRIAVGGLSVGVISLSLAYAFGGHELTDLLDHRSLLASGCSGNTASDNHSSERHIAWRGGDTIDIAMPATVRLHGGEGSDVVVRGAPDIISRVAVHGDKIMLDCHGRSLLREVEVVLPGIAFRRIGLSGSGSLTLENLSQKELSLRISGSGDVRAQGSVDRLNASISGSGNAKMGDLAVRQLSIKISGSGNVEASPQDDAEIHVSGAGNVRLLTRPKHLDSKISGSGRIVQPSIESADGKK